MVNQLNTNQTNELTNPITSSVADMDDYKSALPKSEKVIKSQKNSNTSENK